MHALLCPFCYARYRNIYNKLPNGKIYTHYLPHFSVKSLLLLVIFLTVLLVYPKSLALCQAPYMQSLCYMAILGLFSCELGIHYISTSATWEKRTV
jgi:hypothetical protein